MELFLLEIKEILSAKKRNEFVDALTTEYSICIQSEEKKKKRKKEGQGLCDQPAHKSVERAERIGTVLKSFLASEVC